MQLISRIFFKASYKFNFFIVSLKYDNMWFSKEKSFTKSSEFGVAKARKWFYFDLSFVKYTELSLPFIRQKLPV